MDEKYRLAELRRIGGRRGTADFRAAWSEAGLALAVHVEGKRQPPWCRGTRVEDSDGLQVWIDTRDVHNVHRAGRFCHRFVFLPGGGRIAAGPTRWPCGCRSIAPASSPAPIRAGLLQVRSEQRRPDGYALEAFIPAEALTGFEPAGASPPGLQLRDRRPRVGAQTFSVGQPLPYQEDPSLWATLELVR